MIERITYVDCIGNSNIVDKLNFWISNGWDLKDKFINITGGGISSLYTIFYEKDLDNKNPNTTIETI